MYLGHLWRKENQRRRIKHNVQWRYVWTCNRVPSLVLFRDTVFQSSDYYMCACCSLICAPYSASYIHEYPLTSKVYATGLGAWSRPWVAAVIIHLLTEADLVLRAATVLEVARVKAEAAFRGVQAKTSSMAGAKLSDTRRTGYWEKNKDI